MLLNAVIIPIIFYETAVPIPLGVSLASGPQLPDATISSCCIACKNLSPHLLQMNLLMRKKNIKTSRTKWTKRSLNCPGSKCGMKLVGAPTRCLDRRVVEVGSQAGGCCKGWGFSLSVPSVRGISSTKRLLRTDLTDGRDAPPATTPNYHQPTPPPGLPCYINVRCIDVQPRLGVASPTPARPPGWLVGLSSKRVFHLLAGPACGPAGRGWVGLVVSLSLSFSFFLLLCCRM